MSLMSYPGNGGVLKLDVHVHIEHWINKTNKSYFGNLEGGDGPLQPLSIGATSWFGLHSRFSGALHPRFNFRLGNLVWPPKYFPGSSIDLGGQTLKLECVLKFCNLGDTLSAGVGVEEAARTRVCAWGKIKKLSPILIAHAAHHIT